LVNFFGKFSDAETSPTQEIYDFLANVKIAGKLSLTKLIRGSFTVAIS